MEPEIPFILSFNNAGGITLQTPGYCHTYWGREEQAAEDVHALLTSSSADPSGWDGNQPEDREQWHSPPVWWLTQFDREDTIEAMKEDKHSGHAEADFFRCLHQLTHGGAK